MNNPKTPRRESIPIERVIALSDIRSWSMAAQRKDGSMVALSSNRSVEIVLNINL